MDERKPRSEHIHANCDCTYAVRFDGKSTVQGYDPDKYLRQYEAAEGDTWQEKLNSMNREHRAANREKINEQKRIAYRARKEKEQVLHTFHDPMREKMGAAFSSHPQEMKRIEKALKRKGIEITPRSGSMGYSPHPTGGKPGKLIMDPEASYSAWLHELKHLSDDEASGWMGFRLIEDAEKFADLEDAAYDVEIDFARKNGYNRIVKRLERLKFERRQEILGIQRNNRQAHE